MTNQQFGSFAQPTNSDFGVLIEQYEQEHDLAKEMHKINVAEHKLHRSFVREFRQSQHKVI